MSDVEDDDDDAISALQEWNQQYDEMIDEVLCVLTVNAVVTRDDTIARLTHAIVLCARCRISVRRRWRCCALFRRRFRRPLCRRFARRSCCESCAMRTGAVRSNFVESETRITCRALAMMACATFTSRKS